MGSDLVGAGGVWIRSDGIGRLVWGIIKHEHHRKGYGRELAHFRLKQLALVPELERIQLETSQHNPGFFKRLGFVETSVKKDSYHAGLHSHNMELKLDAVSRQRILER